jgi:hypothetical protein
MTHLGWSSGIGLGPWSVVLFRSHVRFSGANLGGLIYLLQKNKIWSMIFSVFLKVSFIERCKKNFYRLLIGIKKESKLNTIYITWR